LILLGRGHDPENGTGLLEFGPGEHSDHEFKAGEPRELYPGKRAPEQHHEAGIGDG
jgi:hypothetical protein